MRPALAASIAFVSLLAGCVAAPGSGLLKTSTGGPASQEGLGFSTVHVNGGGFEPRIAIGPNGDRWISTMDRNGTEVVYRSADGGLTWALTPTNPPVPHPGGDNEVTVTPTGRVLSSIINDTGTTQMDIHYTDDGGKTWRASTGDALVDQDRQFLTVGTKDPKTGEYDVYMLWHNLFSGPADHEMFVSTSHDGGATFGAPVPITPPGSAAWSDLQCADSGGAGNVFANPKTGQVYAVWGTRSSAAGGCGAAVTQQFQINIVAATRVWVATSHDQGATWTDSLAVDDASAGKIVGNEDQSGALDDKGNVYIVYPESPKAYPNYEGAAVKYVWAAPDLAHWSAPVTVLPSVGDGQAPGTGHIHSQIAVGDPGHVAVFTFTGDGNGTKALWYPTVAETWDGMNATPTFAVTRVSPIPAWRGTASQLMGICNPVPQVGPLSTVLSAPTQGLLCGRSSDILGQAIDAHCDPTFVWYDDTGLNKTSGGTYVTTQGQGAGLCSAGTL
ncbi:MAG: hypothetical protein ACYDDF_05440 [Thermoplasmatota archaeon]